MAIRTSEAIVLRTYPFREGDLIVSFLSRDQGKMRGVARRARKLKSNFGSGLERLSHVRFRYYQKENAELVSLESCDLIASQFSLLSGAVGYENGVALDYLTEVADLLLPAHETSEKFFRLMLAVLGELHAGEPLWKPVTYFTLWAVRLQGFLPDLSVNDESADIMREVFSRPVREMAPREWKGRTGRDLRRQLVRLIEEQVERKIVTAGLLEGLSN